VGGEEEIEGVRRGERRGLSGEWRGGGDGVERREEE